MNEARNRFVNTFQKTLSDAIDAAHVRKQMEERAKRDALFQEQYFEAMNALNKIPELVAKAILQNKNSVAFYEIKDINDITEEKFIDKMFELAEHMPTCNLKTKSVDDKWYVFAEWK